MMFECSNLVMGLPKFLWIFLGSHTFLLGSITVSLILKFFFVVFLLKNRFYNRSACALLLLLLLILTGGIIEDIAWVFKLVEEIFFPGAPTSTFAAFFIRIAWGFFALRYQALALFIFMLSGKIFRLRWHQWPFLIISCAIFVLFIGLAILSFYHRFSFEFHAFGITSFYLLFPLMISSLFFTFWELRSKKVPKLIRRQLNIFTTFFVIPTVLLDILQFYPFQFLGFNANTMSVVGLSTMAMALTIYYCLRKIMGLRFLNIHKNVRAKKQFGFLDTFNQFVDELASADGERELVYITKNFFKQRGCDSPRLAS